jgi:hypothetical protein
VWSEEGGWSNTESFVSHAQESKDNETFIVLWTLGLISSLFHWDWFSNLGVQETHVHSERCTKYGLNEDFFNYILETLSYLFYWLQSRQLRNVNELITVL